MIFLIFAIFSPDSLLYAQNVIGHYFLTDVKQKSIADKDGWTFIVFTGYPSFKNSQIYYMLRSPTTSFVEKPIDLFEDPPFSGPVFDGSPVLIIDSSYDFKVHIFWNSERNIAEDRRFYWQTDIFYSYSVGSYLNFPQIENVSDDINSFDLFPSATCDKDNRIYVVYWKIKVSEESIYLAERDNFGNWYNKRVTDTNEIAENPLIVTLDNNEKLIFYTEVRDKNKIMVRKFDGKKFSEPFFLAYGEDYSVNFKNGVLYLLCINQDTLSLKKFDYELNEIDKTEIDNGNGLFIKNASSVFILDTLYIFYERGNNINTQIWLVKYKDMILSEEILVNSIGKNSKPIPVILSDGYLYLFFESDRRHYTEGTNVFPHIYYKKKPVPLLKRNKESKINVFFLPRERKNLKIFNIAGRRILSEKFTKGVYIYINKKKSIKGKWLFIY